MLITNNSIIATIVLFFQRGIKHNQSTNLSCMLHRNRDKYAGQVWLGDAATPSLLLLFLCFRLIRQILQRQAQSLFSKLLFQDDSQRVLH